VAKPEQAVVGEEPNGVDEGEVERLARSRRPESGAKRNEEVVAELGGIALLGDVSGKGVPAAT